MRAFYWIVWLVITLAAILFSLSCDTERSLTPNANQPPETHLFLHFSDTLQLPGETTSMQVLHWYGDDADGEIVGFEWAWDDTSSWTPTTLMSDTFYVPIRVPQDTFTFFIRAIDNQGAKDPTPDKLSFPIRNSPPTVVLPVDFTQRYSRVIYNSFSYFSIGWTGSDPDNDATITNYYWYLADSSFAPWDSITADSIWWNQSSLDTMSWTQTDSLTNLAIFSDLQPGSYRFFLRCKDVANAYSSIVFYPDKVNGAAWNVLPVVGNVLYIDDNNYFFTSDSVNINGALSDIYGEGNYSTWNVTARVSYYPRDIENTLRLFDIVVWNGSSYPHFRESATAISNYLAAGGHLFAFSTQARADTTIYPFLPMDSVTTPSISRIFSIFKFSTAPGTYPDTLVSPSPLSYSYAFRPASPGALLPQPVEPLYYTLSGNDTLIVSARYPAHSSTQWIPAQVVYFSMYVFDCNQNNRFYDLMRLILTQEFAHESR